MRLLGKLYAAGAVLAAVFMVLIAALTLSQVVGRAIGIVVPDAGDLAGYAMAAATFLALAHTFRSGGHIRVNLVLAHVGTAFALRSRMLVPRSFWRRSEPSSPPSRSSS